MIFSHIKYAQYRESLKITEEIPTGMAYVHTTKLRVKRNKIIFRDSNDKDNYVLLNDADVKSYIETRTIELEAARKAELEQRRTEAKAAYEAKLKAKQKATSEATI